MTHHSDTPHTAGSSSKGSNTTEVVRKELSVRGNQLVERFKEIADEGNARRVIIKREGHTLMEFPLTVGVGGAAAAVMMNPALAALGAIGAMLSDVKVIVEHVPTEDDAPGTLPDAPTQP